MDYISAKTAAEKWGIGLRRVQSYCLNGKIPGAVNMGKQWMIPSAAERPADGRTKQGRTAQAASDPYRFPVLIHSRYFTDRAFLTPDETRLLDAQTLHISGNYAESISICHSIFRNGASPSVLYGAHLTILFNSMLLGISTEIPHQLSVMEMLCNAETVHQEDYRLILAYAQLHLRWDTSVLEQIDASKLSPDALDFYQYAIFTNQAISGTHFPKSFNLFYEAYCRKLDSTGITPLIIGVHSMLSLIDTINGRPESGKSHIAAASSLCLQRGWINYLAKFYGFNPNGFSHHFSECYPDMLETLIQKQDINVRNWNMIRRSVADLPLLDNLCPEDFDLLVLLTYDMSRSEIASVMGFSIEFVNMRFDELQKRKQLSSDQELAQLAKELFPIADSSSPKR